MLPAVWVCLQMGYTQCTAVVTDTWVLTIYITVRLFWITLFYIEMWYSTETSEWQRFWSLCLVTQLTNLFRRLFSPIEAPKTWLIWVEPTVLGGARNHKCLVSHLFLQSLSLGYRADSHFGMRIRVGMCSGTTHITSTIWWWSSSVVLDQNCDFSVSFLSNHVWLVVWKIFYFSIH